MLVQIADQLRQSLGVLQKQDIQIAARYLGLDQFDAVSSSRVRLGDDCAVLPEGEGYLLLAAEGMLPTLVDTEPWFAGWCAVMVNISDIYAMGGRPIAIVDALWSRSHSVSEGLWAGMQAAARAYEVPIVGGHTNCRSPYNALAATILGRATHLITSFDARPGDILLAAIDLQGQREQRYPFWNAATQADPIQLRQKLAVLPQLAAAGLCDAGKDISMGGVVGTALMLLETSGVGAVLDLDAIPRPPDVPLPEWLSCFPSYGFLLSVRPAVANAVAERFRRLDISCTSVGTIDDTRQLVLRMQNDSVVFWDLGENALTGFAPQSHH